jgi:hypothetical protein
MNEKEKIETQIKNWLEKQGYPLEMEVAAYAAKQGFEVSQSDYYIDQDDGKPREIDLVLSKKAVKYKDFSIGYHLCVECKSGKEKPWLLLASDDLSIYSNLINNFLLHNSYATTKIADEILIQSYCLGNSNNIFPRLTITRIVGYGVTQAFSETDIPFKALMTAGKAAYDYLRRNNGAELTIPVHLFIPVVVIDAPLFSVVRTKESNLEINPINRATLLWNQVIAGRSRNCIHIVRKSHIEEFLSECSKSADWWLNMPKETLISAKKISNKSNGDEGYIF